jgi:hypothetical protein
MRIERSTLISMRIDLVFAFVAEPHNDPLWCPKVQQIEQTCGDGPAPGAEYRVVHRPVPFLPARQMTYTLTAWDPPHRIQWHEDDGRDLIDVTYALEAVKDQTRFTQTDEAKLSAPRILHPVMRAGIGHDIAAQLRRLRRYLEATPARHD